MSGAFSRVAGISRHKLAARMCVPLFRYSSPTWEFNPGGLVVPAEADTVRQNAFADKISRSGACFGRTVRYDAAIT
jgi:hypothetical protein